MYVPLYIRELNLLIIDDDRRYDDRRDERPRYDDRRDERPRYDDRRDERPRYDDRRGGDDRRE